MIQQAEAETSEVPVGLPPAEEKPTVMPLLTGGGGPEDLPQAEADEYEQENTNRRLKAQGILLIVLVAIIAAGSLYAMRMTHSDLTHSGVATAAEAKIDTALAKLQNPSLLDSKDPLSSANMESLNTTEFMGLFNTDPVKQQVPIKDVKKNPFMLLWAQGEAPLDPGNSTSAVNHQRSKRLEELRQELGSYDLQTIMTGSRSVAIINGNFVQRGDRLGSFRVKLIDKLVVHLQAEGETFNLTLQ